jgi:transposase
MRAVCAIWVPQRNRVRNVIERCYRRLQDFRRIARRYDKLARNYFSALNLVAAVVFCYRTRAWNYFGSS